MQSSARILLTSLGGGLAVGVLWLLINLGPPEAAGGWLEQQPWPLSSLFACAALGVALLLLQGLFSAGREQRRAEDLRRVAAGLGMVYRPEASREDLADSGQLQVFSHWHRGWNRVYGRFQGLDVQMVDFTAVEPAAGRLSQVAAGSQTVLVVRVHNACWPVFRVYPRSLTTWVWGLLGCRGLRFYFREPRRVTGPDLQTLRRFNRRYYVIIGAAARAVQLAGLDTGVPLETGTLETRQIADRFTVNTLRRLAVSRGWCVESCGTHVAFWRSGRVVPPAQRETLLSEVTGLFRCLDEPTRHPADASLEVEFELPDALQLGRRVSGLIGGAVAGMLLAMLICFPALAALPLESARRLILLWPPLVIAAMAAGAYLAARLSRR